MCPRSIKVRTICSSANSLTPELKSDNFLLPAEKSPDFDTKSPVWIKNFHQNHLHHLNTQDRTTSLPPNSGCNKTLASQNWSSLRRPSRKAGRKRARAAFGGRVGSDGRREYYVRNGCQTRNKEKKKVPTGRLLFNVSCNSSNSEYRFKICIVVPYPLSQVSHKQHRRHQHKHTSLVWITQS